MYLISFQSKPEAKPADFDVWDVISAFFDWRRKIWEAERFPNDGEEKSFDHN